MSQYAIFLYAPAVDEETDPSPEGLAAHDRHSEELQASGEMVTAFALAPTEMSTSMRGDLITDGPFLESKEVVLGFYVVEAPDLDAALGIARRNPINEQGGGVEVRPVVGGVVVGRDFPAVRG